MRKADLQQQVALNPDFIGAIELIKQLSTENLKAVIDYLNCLHDKAEREAIHESASDFETVLDDILRNYDQAWKTLAKP